MIKYRNTKPQTSLVWIAPRRSSDSRPPLAPVVPLALTMMSLEELLKKLFGILF
jgi:hypothetical protein